MKQEPLKSQPLRIKSFKIRQVRGGFEITFFTNYKPLFLKNFQDSFIRFIPKIKLAHYIAQLDEAIAHSSFEVYDNSSICYGNARLFRDLRIALSTFKNIKQKGVAKPRSAGCKPAGSKISTESTRLNACFTDTLKSCDDEESSQGDQFRKKSKFVDEGSCLTKSPPRKLGRGGNQFKLKNGRISSVVKTRTIKK